MAERITQAEFARREGVSRPTVTRWIQQGRISPPGPDGKLDAEQAHQERLLTESPLPKHQGAKAWYDAKKAAAANAAPSGSQPDQPPPAAPHDTPKVAAPQSQLTAKQQDISAALKLETWRLQKAKAEQANLALDRDAGLLVERGIVEYLLRDLGESIRTELTSFADLHTPQLVSARGDSSAIHQQLTDAMHATLNRLADLFDRCADANLPSLHTPGSDPE